MGIKKSRLLNRILMYTLNIFLAVVFLAPLVWMMVSSVKPEVNIFADMTSVRAFLPISGCLDNYRSILEKGEIVRTTPQFPENVTGFFFNQFIQQIVRIEQEPEKK